MLSVTTTQRLRKRRVGSPAQLGLQSLLVASPLSAAVSLAVPFLFRHASTNHHGRIWPCVIRRPTRAGGHAIGDVFVTEKHYDDDAAMVPSDSGSEGEDEIDWITMCGRMTETSARSESRGGAAVALEADSGGKIKRYAPESINLRLKE